MKYSVTDGSSRVDFVTLAGVRRYLLAFSPLHQGIASFSSGSLQQINTEMSKMFFAVSLLLTFAAQARTGVQSRSPNTTCIQIAKAISPASDVYFPGTLIAQFSQDKHLILRLRSFCPGSLLYTQDVNHFATSSSDVSACSVEPGTAEDVAKIVCRLFNDLTYHR